MHERPKIVRMLYQTPGELIYFQTLQRGLQGILLLEKDLFNELNDKDLFNSFSVHFPHFCPIQDAILRVKHINSTFFYLKTYKNEQANLLS